MANKTKLAVIGGDTRQIYAADRLQKSGYDITLTGFEYFDSAIKPTEELTLKQALKADILLLPLPFSKNGRTVNAPYSKSEIPVKELIDGITEKHRIFVGNADIKTFSRLSASGAYIYDYFTDESLTLYNALLTAEGLLGMIIDKLPCSVFGSNAAVTGFGRIGFYLSRLLHSAGADITVFARSPGSRAKARTLGLSARDIESLKYENFRFDCLVNTVPAKILKREELSHLNTGCFLFEAASAPYGIDFDAAVDMGFDVYKAFSLPGKTSPKSAGCIIAETVNNKLTGVSI